MTFKVSSSLAEQITEYISDKIIRMEIKPGERVLENNIARELGVSRSPIREALRILEKTRLVELVPRKGARVTEMSENFIEQLCDIFSALMGLTGKKCVENGTSQDFKRIDNAAKTCQRCVQDGDTYGYYRSVFDFAMACLKATKSPLLQQMVSELMPSIQRLLYASFSIKGEDLKNNVEIVLIGNQYVQDRNGLMAEHTVCEYIRKEKEFVLKNNIFS
jgi:DNA-binding GntR family transcriptional regulator